MLIHGNAGVGKTTLASSLLAGLNAWADARWSGYPPMVLHVEDAHLLDTSSATVLAELAQSTSVRVLATNAGADRRPRPRRRPADGPAQRVTGAGTR